MRVRESGPCENVRQEPVSGAKDEVAATEIDSNRQRLRNVNVSGNMHVNGNVKGILKGGLE